MTQNTPGRARFARPVAAALLALALALTGCTASATTSPTPSATDGSQSVSDACATARDSVADAVEALRTLDPSDPEGAIAALTTLGDDVATAAGAIDNARVASALADVQAGFASTVEVLQRIAGGDLSQLVALQGAVADLQSALAAFGDLCTTP